MSSLFLFLCTPFVLKVADHVIMMDCYSSRDVTDQAKVSAQIRCWLKKELNKTIWGERESKECNKFKREGNIESVLKNLQEMLEETSPICVHGSVAVTFCRTFHQGHVFPRFFVEVTFPRLFANANFPALFSCCGLFSRPFYLFPYFTRYMMFQLTKLFPVVVPCRCLGHCYGA